MSAAAANFTVLDVIAGTVSSTLKIPPARLDVDASFDSFGMDSIIAMELMTNLSKQLKISITPAQLTQVSSIRELAALIDTLMRESEPAVAPKPQAVAAPRPRPATALSSAGSLKHILQFVKSEFDIDLRGLRFASKAVLIDHLLEHHAEVLLRHYGLFTNEEVETDVASATEQGVAIVGMACQFADARTPNALWQNLLSGKSSIKPLTGDRWNPHAAPEAASSPRWGALIDEVDSFDAAFFDLTEKEATLIDPQERLLMQSLYHALQHAGIRADKLRGSRTALFLGYEYSEYEHLLRENLHRIADAPAFSSSSPIYYLANRISFLFDFRGPSEVVNASCAASGLAIHRAVQALAQGECDLAVCGGVSLNLFAADYAAIARYGLLSPDGRCAVFDDQANGYTRGEGVGLLVLKRMEDAERDNNRIFAKVIATQQNNRGRAAFMSEIKHEAITEVIRGCYEKHAIAPSSVHYIEVDGYATKWGDSFEFEGIRNAFQGTADGEKHCALGSIKANIGHVEPVSGAASAIKLALSLHHKQFPATITKKTLSSFIDISAKSHPLYIADHSLPFDKLRRANEAIRAGINSFSDSGVNVHLLLEEYRPEHNWRRSEQHGPQLFIFSARTQDALLSYLDDYSELVRTTDLTNRLEDLAYTLQVATEPMEHRVAVVAATRNELPQLLARAKKLVTENKPADGKGPVFHGNVSQRDSRRLLDVIAAQIPQKQLLENLRNRQFDEIALLWTGGIDIPWDEYWRELTVARRRNGEAAPQIVDTALYPFAKKRCWLDLDAVPVAAPASPPILNTASDVTRETPKAWKFVTALDEGEQLERLDAEEKIRLFIIQETASLLRIDFDSIDAGENFLQLGFDSVGMATLIQRLTQLLRENISVSIVFKHQDIDRLSRHLATRYGEKLDAVHVVRIAAPESRDVSERAAGKVRIERPSSDLEKWFMHRESAGMGLIVPMQTRASGTPLFAVAGVEGSVLSLQTLSRAMADVCPMFAFEAVGLDGTRAALESVREMAAANVEALAAMRDIRRLNLLGHSNGAIVAFEMARQLFENNVTVERLVLVDCLCPALPDRSPTDEIADSFITLIRALGGQQQLNIDEFRTLPEADQPGYLRELMKHNGFALPAEQFMHTYSLALANEKACRNYRPEKFQHACETIVVRATQNHGAAPADLGWNEFLARPAICIDIDADHLSVIGKEASVRIAQLFSSDADPASSVVQ